MNAVQPLLSNTIPALQLEGIRMEFGPTRAVDGVDLDLWPGEVHGIIGENGAGKSTLMKVAAGFFDDWQGSIKVEGRPIRLESPAAARREGIALVHQELSLLPELTVAENIVLGREPRGILPGFVSPRETNRWADALLRDFGLDIPARARVERLSLAQRQLVEIIKGIAGNPKVLIFDEPTSSLTLAEIKDLYRLIAKLRATRTAVAYISHKLDELFAVAQTITVLRDGRKVASAPVSDWTPDALIQSMIGRDLSSLFPRQFGSIGTVRLAVRNLARRGVFGPVSLTVRAGEVVGVYGIIGAGRTSLAEAIYGLSPADSGEIWLDDRPVSIRSPGAAIANKIAMAPEDRRTRGIVPMLSVRENMVLASLPAMSRLGFVDRPEEGRRVGSMLRRLSVRARSSEQEIASLSGGNQQKVVLGRALMAGPGVLILDEPTRGIDVGAKAEVHAIVDGLARQGLAVLLLSSELPEIIGMSDRVLVMREGRIVADVPRAELNEERLVREAAGAPHAQ